MKYIHYSVRSNGHAWNEDRGCSQADPVCFIIAWIPSRSWKTLRKVMARDFLLSIDYAA